MKLRRHFLITAAVATVAAVGGTVPVALAGTTLAGGGSSFMANMMDICGAQYNRNTNFNADSDTISYAATGSGTGKTNYANGTYKFGGSESAYSSGAPADLVYVPLIAGPIAVAYKLDGISPSGQALHLSNETVAKIFAGQITKWDDPAIKADNTAKVVPGVTSVTKNGATVKSALTGSKLTLKGTMTSAALKKYKGKSVVITSVTAAGKSKVVYNKTVSAKFSVTVTHAAMTTYAVKVFKTSLGSIMPDDTTTGVTLTLPSTGIKVAYRSGNSGTTNMFTRYLNNTVPSVWTKAANDSFSSAFPGTVPTTGTFQSASGNDGVANYVKSNNGSITYAELSFVEERASSGVKAAEIKNNAGVYVAPSPTATAEFFAEATVADNGLVTPDYTVKSASAYLINAIAYGLSGTKTSASNTAVKNFFGYFLNQCAPKNASGAGYAALTGSILTKSLAQVAKISTTP